jgi:protein involved in polysaccharide export with SLBB domain
MSKKIFMNIVISAFVFSGIVLAQAGPGNSSQATPPASVNPGQTAGPVTKDHPEENYVIGDGDVLGINVWKEQELTVSIPVRLDGKISLPLIGEVQASGKTPLQLKNDITTKLLAYLSAPDVTVTVQQMNSQKFNILGRVAKPGAYPLSRNRRESIFCARIPTVARDASLSTTRMLSRDLIRKKISSSGQTTRSSYLEIGHARTRFVYIDAAYCSECSPGSAQRNWS